MVEFCNEIAESEGVTIEAVSLARFEPVEFNQRVIDSVEHQAKELGLSTRRMPSGAGHDAQMLSRVAPAAMVFVPSVNGISHNVAEFTQASRQREWCKRLTPSRPKPGRRGRRAE